MNFQKTTDEKLDLKLAKKAWKKGIKAKYPEDNRPADKIWLDHLTVNSKF